MLILADAKIPPAAKRKLRKYGDLAEVSTAGTVYEALSGHPDIFFCPVPGAVIAAPNAPENVLTQLKKHGIKLITGSRPVDAIYPGSAVYNAVVTSSLLVHRLDITDKSLLDFTQGLQKLHVNQGYTRCSLLPLSGNHFITSDRGIEKNARDAGLTILYTSPGRVILEGYPNGFFGGACGVWDNKLFIIGRLDTASNYAELSRYLSSLDFEVVELYDGPLTDCGSIFFLE